MVIIYGRSIVLGPKRKRLHTGLEICIIKHQFFCKIACLFYLELSYLQNYVCIILMSCSINLHIMQHLSNMRAEQLNNFFFSLNKPQVLAVNTILSFIVLCSALPLENVEGKQTLIITCCLHALILPKAVFELFYL